MANNEGNDSGTGDSSQIDLLSEIQKLRTEKDEILKQIKLKIDAQTEKLTEENGRKLNELWEKISKNSKIDEDVETTEKLKQVVGELKNISIAIDSAISQKVVPKTEKRFLLKHVFTNVEELVSDINYYDSSSENHFSIDCCISIKRLYDHLACYVHIRGPENGIKWAVETKVELRIYGKNQKIRGERFDHLYEKNGGYGFHDILNWDEMEDEYLIDGSLTVEAHVQIIETSGLGKEKIRKFDESQKDVSDLVVSVRNTKFYVARMFLAAQSSFFKALLLGNFAESKKSEITLTGIDPTDFHYFLEVLYGELAIDEYNVEGILLLADMYDAPTAIRRCETFLFNESKKSLKKKLQMAARYRLENLKNKCMKEIKTNEDVRSILPANINDLDHEIMGELLKKSISFR